MTEIWLRIEAFFDILSTRNVLIEVGALALCVCFGGIGRHGAAPARPRQANKPPMALSWEYFATQGNGGGTTGHRGARAGTDRPQHAAGGAFRRHFTGRRRALDRCLHRGAHRGAAVRRQSGQQILDSKLGNARGC